jgi:hypothetical protein
VGEFSKAALEARFGGQPIERMGEEIIQVAAVALAMVECYYRNGFGLMPSNEEARADE